MKSYEDHVLIERFRESQSGIPNASAFALVLTKHTLEDPMCALHIGLAIVSEKPFMVIADPSVRIPSALIKIARMVERIELESEAGKDRALKSVKEFMASIRQPQ